MKRKFTPFRSRGVRAALFACGVGFLSAFAAQAQVVNIANSGTINYDRRGWDFLISTAPNNPIVFTIGSGATISSNADAADGYEGVEIFNYNEVHLNGGAIVAEGGRKGGLRLHDNSTATINGGSLNYLWQRDSAYSYFQGGFVNECLMQDQSGGYLYGGYLASLSLLSGRRFEVYRGIIGPAGIRVFGKSALRLYGSDFRVSKSRSAIVSGVSGVSFFLTGFLTDGGKLATNIFVEGAFPGGNHNGDSNRLFFNDLPVIVTAAAPDAPAGLLLFLGVIIARSAQVFFRRFRRT